jgi:hypothetical protein
MVDTLKKNVPIVLSSLFVISIAALVLLGSMPAAAETGPKTVMGTVYDNSGNPLADADITAVVINAGNSTIMATEIDVTGPEGAYSVTFDPAVWQIGDTLRVTATYSSVQQTNQTTATIAPFQIVDVHFTTAIPQFGSLLGFMAAAGMVCVVGVGFLFYRRKP